MLPMTSRNLQVANDKLQCHNLQVAFYKLHVEIYKLQTCVLGKRPSFTRYELKLTNGTVHSCLNTNIYSYLETSGGQSSNPYLNVVHFLNTRVD